MRLPDFVVNVGTDPQGKHHAFYIDIDGSEMRGPSRDTAEEAKIDAYTCLANFSHLAVANGLIVGDGKKH